jgi:predicted metal-dependent hydrolase
VQFEFLLNPDRRPQGEDFLAVGARRVPMILIRNRRARRYVLRLWSDGVARVTVPRGGSEAEARRFAERNRPWLEQQFQKLAARPKHRQSWLVGTEILFRGETVKIETGANGESRSIRFGSEVLTVSDPSGNLRTEIERHLWNLAAIELPPVVLQYATIHKLAVRRITVRNQRSRWGSCSRRGTISLNWRLIQTPPFVRDYIILHELAHLREMNHSARFWSEVERLCPGYKTAELWLKKHCSLLIQN